MTDDRAMLRTTFDSAAARYQRARPDYPTALFDDLVTATGITSASALVEVGCGPGKATLPLAERGFGITAVELGPALAAEARRALAGYPRVSVETAAFETWHPAHPVDLVYAATAWKWVDPAVRYQRAAAALRSGGHLALWAAGHAFPPGFDPFFTEIQSVYEELGEARENWPPPPPEDIEDPTAAELTASGLFEVVATHRYVWARTYTAETYLDLLDTFSGHIAMSGTARAHLHGAVRRLLADRSDGLLTRHWSAVLTVGRRSAPLSDARIGLGSTP